MTCPYRQFFALLQPASVKKSGMDAFSWVLFLVYFLHWLSLPSRRVLTLYSLLRFPYLWLHLHGCFFALCLMAHVFQFGQQVFTVLSQRWQG